MLRFGRSVLFSVALACSGLVLCLSCAVFYEQPEIVFRGVRLGDTTQARVELEVSAEISNPNRYRLALKSLGYHLRINGNDAATGSTDSELAVPARGSAIVTLPVIVDWRNVKAAGWEALATGSLEYSIEGEAVFSTPVGTFRRPFRRVGKFGL